MTTEADKDKGIDEILHMNIPDKDKAHFIGDLCKHRGKCMDQDAKTIEALKAGVEGYRESNQLYMSVVNDLKRHITKLENNNMTMSTRLITWLNNWAKP